MDVDLDIGMTTNIHPETCPRCGLKHREKVELIDDDGNIKYYRCERCHLTWRQNGFNGKPVISSIDGGAKTLYNAFRNIGYSDAKAKDLVYGNEKRAKLVKKGGTTWQIIKIYLTLTSAKIFATQMKNKGNTTMIRRTKTSTGSKYIVYSKLG
jgi:hypothetical protein